MSKVRVILLCLLPTIAYLVFGLADDMFSELQVDWVYKSIFSDSTEFATLIMFPYVIYVYLKDIKFSKLFASVMMLGLLLTYVLNIFGTIYQYQNPIIIFAYPHSETTFEIVVKYMVSVIGVALPLIAVLVLIFMRNRISQIIIGLLLVITFAYTYDLFYRVFGFTELSGDLIRMIEIICRLCLMPIVLFFGFKEVKKI